MFFFFKQKTAYEMRISDWSSDVCSSDLARELLDRVARRPVVAESCRGDEAELAASDVPARAGAEVGGEVNRDVVVPLKKRSRRVLQARCDILNVARREIGALGDQLAAVQRRFERAADRTCAVVIAEQIEVTAIIGIAELSGGLGIAADAAADVEERLVGKRLRREEIGRAHV